MTRLNLKACVIAIIVIPFIAAAIGLIIGGYF